MIAGFDFMVSYLPPRVESKAHTPQPLGSRDLYPAMLESQLEFSKKQNHRYPSGHEPRSNTGWNFSRLLLANVRGKIEHNSRLHRLECIRIPILLHQE